jgi:hypothetical protein
MSKSQRRREIKRWRRLQKNPAELAAMLEKFTSEVILGIIERASSTVLPLFEHRLSSIFERYFLNQQELYTFPPNFFQIGQKLKVTVKGRIN